METLQHDVTVVGAGIAGLWSAKELIDQGLSVCVVERSGTLANGATTKNEGWLHAGTYHAVAVEDEEEALRVTERTLYGHDAIVDFAPESIDHTKSFALFSEDHLVHKALYRWGKAGVISSELSASQRANLEVRTAGVHTTFEVKDKSVNSVTLCQKLARYIIDSGGRILTGANFMPQTDTSADIVNSNGERQMLRSNRFLLTSGAGIRLLHKELTGHELLMRYFKAHLLVAPRLFRDNYFYMGSGEAGVMSHGKASIVGVNRDGIELSQPDYAITPSKENLVRNAVLGMMPQGSLPHFEGQFTAIACCKPDIYTSHKDTQSLNVQIFEAAPNYICALPGKMTEAPYLGRAAMLHVIGGYPDSPHHIPPYITQDAIPLVTPRPMDYLI
ncbi:MAG TPA: FAD-dependent oxidoreductase [Candidatus Saccharimonadales bacterium]|nr:FAD-dependent oxidoreductase [Candidatus Saccharimonadales bacterium]